MRLNLWVWSWCESHDVYDLLHRLRPIYSFTVGKEQTHFPSKPLNVVHERHTVCFPSSVFGNIGKCIANVVAIFCARISFTHILFSLSRYICLYVKTVYSFCFLVSPYIRFANNLLRLLCYTNEPSSICWKSGFCKYLDINCK